MKKVFNYLGQLRLYSLADLVLLLFAIHTGTIQFIGALLLWIGFLALLEFHHRHKNRNALPAGVWVSFFVLGGFFFGWIGAFGFLVTSYLYSLKVKPVWGKFSVLFRGLQTVFLIGAIIGYTNPLTWGIAFIILIRNLLGDIRDARKDHTEGMETLPVVLGQRRGIGWIHLAGVLVTSVIWYGIGQLPFWYLLVAIAIEISTYTLTPR